PRALPVDVRAAVLAALLPAVHARVERDRPAPLRLRPDLAARAARRRPAARGVDRVVDHDGARRARRPALHGVPVAGADRAADLSRPRRARAPALPLAAPRTRRDTAGRLR